MSNLNRNFGEILNYTAEKIDPIYASSKAFQFIESCGQFSKNYTALLIQVIKFCAQNWLLMIHRMSDIAKDAVFVPTGEFPEPNPDKVEGYDFENGCDYDKLFA